MTGKHVEQTVSTRIILLGSCLYGKKKKKSPPVLYNVAAFITLFSVCRPFCRDSYSRRWNPRPTNLRPYSGRRRRGLRRHLATTWSRGSVSTGTCVSPGRPSAAVCWNSPDCLCVYRCRRSSGRFLGPLTSDWTNSPMLGRPADGEILFPSAFPSRVSIPPFQKKNQSTIRIHYQCTANGGYGSASIAQLDGTM